MEYFIVAVYLFTVWFFWKKVPFSQPRKVLFSVSMFPLFATLMFLNIWVTDTFLPDLMGALDTARAADEQLKASGRLYRKIEMQEPLVAFAISTPIAVLFSFAWFYLFLVWERRSKSKLRGGENGNAL